MFMCMSQFLVTDRNATIAVEVKWNNFRLRTSGGRFYLKRQNVFLFCRNLAGIQMRTRLAGVAAAGMQGADGTWLGHRFGLRPRRPGPMESRSRAQ